METTSFHMWNNAAYEDHSKENLQPLLLLHTNSPSPMDAEIEEIQRQITHLTSRLTSLRLQKTNWFSKPVLPQATPLHRVGKVKATPPMVKNRKRSVSMGPSEITQATRGSTKKEEARCTRASPGLVTRKKGSVKVGSRFREKKGEEEEEEVVVMMGRRKRRWEIPRELVLHSSEEEEEAVGERKAILEEGEEEEVVLLPRIRTSKCMFLSPRDSGAAKRVADLEGKTTFFSIAKHDCGFGYEDEDEDDDDGLVCQSLDFGEG